MVVVVHPTVIREETVVSIRSYRDLDVWQRSMELALESHALVRRFPIDERFALTAQMRRAAISVPSNVAEGNASGYRALYVSHVGRAQGSLAELETQMILAERFDYLSSPVRFWELSDEVSRMLVALRRSLNRRP